MNSEPVQYAVGLIWFGFGLAFVMFLCVELLACVYYGLKKAVE